MYWTYLTKGWYYDSNNVFLISQSKLIKYDGSSYSSHYWPSSFSSYCISGYDENNVYIGGNSLGRAMLKKWNGSVFSDYLLVDTVTASNFFTVYVANQNELWLSSSTDGKVYKFDGNSYQSFLFNKNYWYIEPFMKDEQGNIYFSGKIYYQSNSIDSALVELQKYDGTNWEIVFSRMYPSQQVLFTTQNIGTDIFALIDQSLYKFNGSDFILSLNITPFLLLNNSVSASSFNNAVCKGYDFSSRKDCLFFWDGNKWSKEFAFNEGGNTNIIHSNYENIFIIDYNYQSNRTILIKGKRIHSFTSLQ